MTEKEKSTAEVMRRNGCTYRAIADKLHLSLSTVKAHCNRHSITISHPTQEEAPVPTVPLCKRYHEVIINTPGHRQRVFCSDRCRILFWKEHPDKLQRKALVSKACLACGTEFDDYEGHHKKFCSHICYINYRYKRAYYES